MRILTLLFRNLAYFWRSNLAVVLGVATAVAVLSGALLVGDSVRGSLQDLFAQRLGRTDDIVASTSFFREDLTEQIQSDPRFTEAFNAACPMIVMRGIVADEKSGRRASAVQVYGVDARFWKFHAREAFSPPGEREAYLSSGLARELGTTGGQTVLLRIEKPTAIPAGSLHGRKEDLGRTIRLTAGNALAAADLGEFSLRPSQDTVRAIFISLARLQKDLELPGKINTLLFAEKQLRDGGVAASAPSLLAQILKETFALEDLGITLRPLDERRGVALETQSAIISDELHAEAKAAAQEIGAGTRGVLSYLANSIRVAEREVPYSLVTAVDDVSFSRSEGLPPHSESEPASARSQSQGSSSREAQPLPGILLNEWAASDLQVRTGDVVTLDYYLWKDEGTLSTETAQFRFTGVVPIKDEGADRDFVPDYPGITATENISDWDPPFPVDLKRVRPRDEDYWHRYRTTPKAFVSLDAGQRLWQSRYGKLTSLRLVPSAGRDLATLLESFRRSLRARLDPTENGFTVTAARLEGVQASRGATDFGEYFVYFSFFLVAGALLLASLFFKLGIEQRLREIGTLRAIGFPAARVRSIFAGEGLVLALAGSLLGVAAAVGYGELMMYGLRTWWVDAVGTTNLSLRVSPLSLIIGGIGGVIIALLCIVWTLRRLAGSSPRGLLTGSLDAARQSGLGPAPSRAPWSTRTASIVFSITGIGLLIAASLGWTGQTGGFFGAGTLLLAAMLSYEYRWLTRRQRSSIQGRGWWPVSKLGLRNATYHPGRSVLCIALIASAAFIIVAVDAFRRGGDSTLDRKSGTGGFPLQAESVLSLYHDPNTEEGREELNLATRKGIDPASVTFTRFRVRPGDDASCLNLYQPRNPRILGASEGFIQAARFRFQSSLAQTNEQRDNPWLLLNGEPTDGAVPVIADANSMTYVLHRKLGDEIVVSRSNGESARLQLVGALDDSIFQSELLMSEANFLRLFPDQGGYNFFLLDMAPEAASEAAGVLEEQLSDFGFDAISTSEKLAGFHRVENTYLTTFQTLGGLGLVLGTLGLATVLLRNVLERRRELALLKAIGYNSIHFALMVITENAFLVCCGLVTGGVCALLAIAPAFAARGGHLPGLSLWLLLVVFITGLLASLAATIAALRAPLLPSLRAE